MINIASAVQHQRFRLHHYYHVQQPFLAIRFLPRTLRLPICVSKSPGRLVQSKSWIASSASSTQTAAAELLPNINHHSTEAFPLQEHETTSANLSILNMNLIITFPGTSQQPLTQTFVSMRLSQVLQHCLPPCLVFHALYSTMATLYESVLYVSRECLRSSSAASDLCLDRLSIFTVFAFLRLTVSLCLALSLFLCPFFAQLLSSIITLIQLIALCAYLLQHIYPLGESQLS